jgi:hypothetical protein
VSCDDDGDMGLGSVAARLVTVLIIAAAAVDDAVAAAGDMDVVGEWERFRDKAVGKSMDGTGS